MQSKIDLTELFKCDDDFFKELKKLTKDINEYKNYQNHIYDDLYKFLEFDSSISRRIERLYLYAHINNDLDLDNDKYQDMVGKVLYLYNTLSEITSFVSPEILGKDYSYFESLINKNPKLKEYQNNIKSLFRCKKYIKSKEEEELISSLTASYDKPENISEMLINTDLKYGDIIDEDGKVVELTNSNFSTYLQSSKRSVRRDAFLKMYDEIKKHSNTFASILATEVLNNNKLSQIRGFKTSRSFALYANQIDEKIYDKLIEGVHNNLNKFYKYYDLKKDILKIDDFHIYDTYASIIDSPLKTYTFEEGKNISIDALKVMGEDYLNTFKKSFENNWIDSTICKTKRSGAYCTSCFDTHPYVVMSYEGKTDDISTLVHELGHAMHYYYAQSNNYYQDSNYSIFVAEVASQVNEIILTDYLYKNTNDKEEKKYLLDLMLQRFKATIVRQTMFAEFEDNLHNMQKEGTVLTKDLITSKYYDLNKLYFGNNVNIDDEIKYECFRIPHFYYNFYVYQYATGYAAAIKIANNIINGVDGALENYIKFLKLGSTKDPVKSLKVAGIDIENGTIYDEVFDIFEEKLELLRSLYE